MNTNKPIRPLISFLQNRLGSLAFVCAASILGGCATLTPDTPEQAVQKRAVEHWQARIDGQLEKAYAFSTPAYRKLRNEAQFKSQFGGSASIETSEVSKVECDPEKCKVQMKLGVKPAITGISIGIVPIYIDEVWVLEEGNWWRYQDM